VTQTRKSAVVVTRWSASAPCSSVTDTRIATTDGMRAKRRAQVSDVTHVISFTLPYLSCSVHNTVKKIYVVTTECVHTHCSLTSHVSLI